ncbi:DnaD/phage-associated family protein [Clostridium punense]|uniref:DnaD/phage-associated family protein n=2 Tax=Clostridiaceae TaxID=31979 RepID=A0ABS4K834_9CLOT|nr:DnaD/phage-associated family protein [Clostridium punense]
MFKNKTLDYTPVSNVFIDKYMAKARGEYVKVYLLGLKYCISGELGANSSLIASTLSLLETDVVNAWNYWHDEGIVKMSSIDNMGNFYIEFLNLTNIQEEGGKNLNLLRELDNSSVKGMLQDIEKLIGRPLSPKEMTSYLGWQKDFNFSPELILLLIQYCVSKGKNDYRYIEKIAMAWHDSNIKDIEGAQSFIKRHEDKWIKIRKILTYLGIKNADIMKPQEEILEKWLSVYKFPIDVIYKACDICFERLNRADFKYIDGILNSWFKDNIKSLEDIEKKDRKKLTHKPIINNSNNSAPSKGNFNNYEQRTYDFDELERKLLGWDNND